MIRDSWSVVRGPWPVVRGPWPVVRGPWSVVRGPWLVVRESGAAYAVQHYKGLYNNYAACRTAGSDKVISYQFIVISERGPHLWMAGHFYARLH